MAEEPQEDIEARAARLAAEVQEATANNKRRVAPGSGRILAAAGLFAVAAIGVGVTFFGNLGKDAPSAPATAQPDAFQTEEGSPFGTLPMPTSDVVVQQDSSEADALRAQMAGLQAELERLKNAPAPEAPETAVPAVDPALVTQLAALQDQIDGMSKSLEAAEKERERALSEKDRELARMQAALDAAALEETEAGTDPALGDLAARRQAAEEMFQRRVASGMIAYGGGGAADAGAGSLDAVGGGGVEGRKLSENEAFAREAAVPAAVERARVIVNPGNTVIQGTMIQAVLETFINSDLPGQIRAVVTEDTHSYDGSRILIPRGSKVIGQYSDNVETGQRRAMVVWNRIIMPDNQTVTISATGGDAIGQAGIGGRVNTHFGERFGSATLISLISALPALALSDSDSDSAQNAADAVAENMTAATAQAMASALNRPPTITVNQGTTISIMVDRDLEIF
jgi:type IV secretion system protein VirB10